MLTTLEANFIQEYKINGGNATQAVIKAGYQAKYPSPLGSQLLKKPHIRKLIETLDARTNATLTQPIVRNPYLPAQVIALPSKEQYALKALERSSDESELKEDTKYKYFDLAGRVLGHANKSSDDNSGGETINIICRELNLVAPINHDFINNQTEFDITSNTVEPLKNDTSTSSPTEPSA